MESEVNHPYQNKHKFDNNFESDAQKTQVMFYFKYKSISKVKYNISNFS